MRFSKKVDVFRYSLTTTSKLLKIASFFRVRSPGVDRDTTYVDQVRPNTEVRQNTNLRAYHVPTLPCKFCMVRSYHALQILHGTEILQLY